MGCMSGLNSSSLQYDTAEIPATIGARAAASFSTMSDDDVVARLVKGNILTSTEASDIANDYGSLHPLLEHPVTFPNADGECPVGMKEAEWIKVRTYAHA